MCFAIFVIAFTRSVLSFRGSTLSYFLLTGQLFDLIFILYNFPYLLDNSYNNTYILYLYEDGSVIIIIIHSRGLSIRPHNTLIGSIHIRCISSASGPRSFDRVG